MTDDLMASQVTDAETMRDIVERLEAGARMKIESKNALGEYDSLCIPSAGALAALNTRAQPTVVVKPLDFSNILKHAFLAGRESQQGTGLTSAEAWVEYDPTESAAYHRILSQITTTPATDVVDIQAIMIAQLGEAAEDGDYLPAEYNMNEIVSDACEFLRDRPAPATEVRAEALREAAKVAYAVNNHSNPMTANDVGDEILSLIDHPPVPVSDFQRSVDKWLDACFGPEIAGDKIERNHRFLEEALELVQSTGCTRSEAHQLVDYVYGRDVGEPSQEVGGVMNTLAALCSAHDMDMMACGETEICRVSTPETILKIRAKQAAKPKHSPLAETPAPVSEPDCPLGDDCDLVAAYNAGVKHAEDKPVSVSEADLEVIRLEGAIQLALDMNLRFEDETYDLVIRMRRVLREALRALTQEPG